MTQADDGVRAGWKVPAAQRMRQSFRPGPVRPVEQVHPIEAEVRRLEQAARTVTSRVATAAVLKQLDAMIRSLRYDYRGPMSTARKAWTRRCKEARQQLANRSAGRTGGAAGGRRADGELDRLCKKYDQTARGQRAS